MPSSISLGRSRTYGPPFAGRTPVSARSLQRSAPGRESSEAVCNYLALLGGASPERHRRKERDGMNTTVRESMEKTIKEREESLSRIADAADIIERHVLPALPATISRFDARQVSGTASYRAAQDRASSIAIQFHPGQLETQSDCATAYGTIVKVAQGLAKQGWEVTEQPEINAYEWAESLFIVIKAERKIAGRKRWYRRHGIIPYQDEEPERVVSLRITFESMPETDVCRIEESVEHVPASTRKVRRVVCEGDGPAALIPSPALKEASR